MPRTLRVGTILLACVAMACGSSEQQNDGTAPGTRRDAGCLGGACDASSSTPPTASGDTSNGQLGGPCASVHQCVGGCTAEECIAECIQQASPTAAPLYLAWLQCLYQNGCLDLSTQAELAQCVEQHCAAETTACFTDQPNAPPDGQPNAPEPGEGGTIPPELVGQWGTVSPNGDIIDRDLGTYEGVTGQGGYHVFYPDGRWLGGILQSAGVSCPATLRMYMEGTATTQGDRLTIRVEKVDSEYESCTGTNRASKAMDTVMQYQWKVYSDAQGPILELLDLQTGTTAILRRVGDPPGL